MNCALIISDDNEEKVISGSKKNVECYHKKGGCRSKVNHNSGKLPFYHNHLDGFLCCLYKHGVNTLLTLDSGCVS